METNVGELDRLLRVVFGFILILAGVMTSIVWLYIGIVPLLTGIFKFCPAYTLFKINTCKTKD